MCSTAAIDDRAIAHQPERWRSSEVFDSSRAGGVPPMRNSSTFVSGPTSMLCRKGLALAALLFTAFLVGESSLAAQTCDRSGCGYISCGTPATAAPPNLWGELQPTDSGTLPLNRNSTAFDDVRGDQYNAFPWYTG